MTLDEYARKRDFGTTPEPAGPSESTAAKELNFVIQKHAATRLHYDLRLELDGVMKSWAVPKGLSLNTSDRKLAVMVEDHPLDYRNFEGIIPEGNYGAGTVMIWDEGTYSVPGTNERSETEHLMRTSLEKGNLLITLHGQKINGSFHIVKMKSGGENNWLIIKKHDTYDSMKDVLLQDRSVRTGRSLEGIRREAEDARAPALIPIENLDFHGALRRAFPKGPIRPMFAQLVKEPFDKEGWFFEIKWDGYRAIAERQRTSTRLYSRHGLSFLNDYPLIVKDLQALAFECILDGEIVVIDKEGRSDFGSLQNYRRTGTGTLVYYVFDLLYLEGHDLRELALRFRKELLKEALPPLQHIRYSDHVENTGTAMFNVARELHLEGIVAKDGGSAYLSGVRTQHWRKIKALLQQEFVIGGFTEPRGGRTSLGALIVGVYDRTDLVYAGSVGGGFTDDQLPRVRAMLEPLQRPTSPFRNPPRTDTSATWVEPVRVCEVRFSEWTADGILRQPVFLGFRNDLDPLQVRRETAVPPAGAAPLRFAVRESDQEEFIEISGRILKLTNLKKVFWPEDRITKGDMIDYYRSIAPFLLPHLRDRPESLHRFPNGIHADDFFQKNIEDAPTWASTVRIPSDTASGITEYLLCQDEAALVYIVNLGAIELNPWTSRIGSLDNPDFMVIDLDPLDCPFEDVITSARMVHNVMNEIKLPSFVKTSGATGLHIFTPLGAQYTYEQARQFAYLICVVVHNHLPGTTSLERMPERRKGKVYLDFLQNTKGKTMASIYSIRPLAGAPVSTPLNWEEVRPGLHPSQFTIHTTRQRLEKYGDIWKPVPGEGVSLAEHLDALRKLF